MFCAIDFRAYSNRHYTRKTIIMIIMISTRLRSYKRLIEKEYAGTEYEIHKYAMNEAAVMKATKVS